MIKFILKVILASFISNNMSAFWSYLECRLKSELSSNHVGLVCLFVSSRIQLKNGLSIRWIESPSNMACQSFRVEILVAIPNAERQAFGFMTRA